MEIYGEEKKQYSLQEILERVNLAEHPDWVLFTLSLDNARKADVELPEIMRACAIPRRFDQQIVGVLRNAPEEVDRNQKLLSSICAHSFVIRRDAGDFVYQDSIREAVLKDWRSSDEKRQQFVALSNRLAEHYKDKYEVAKHLEQDLADASSIMRDANVIRYRKLDSLIRERLTLPLLEALYQRLLASPGDGFSFFQDRFFKLEEADHLLTCQALISAARDFLLRLPVDQQDPAQLAWLEYFDLRILRQLPPVDYSIVEERLVSLSRREDLGAKFRIWTLGQLAIVREDQQKLPAGLQARKDAWALAEESGEDVWNWPSWAGGLGQSYWELGELDHAIEYYRDAIKLSDSKEGARRDMRIHGRCNLSGIYCAAGQWDRGIHTAIEALYLARTEFSDDPEMQSSVSYRLMHLLFAFDQSAAEAAAQEYIALNHGTKERELNAKMEYIRTLDNIGRESLAESELRSLRKESEQAERPSLFLPTLLFQEAYVCDVVGRHEESNEKYRELHNMYGSGLVTNWDKAAALTNRGRLLTIEGQWESADKELRAALQLWEEYGNETMIARVHVMLADLMRKRGLLSDAQKELDTAGKLLDVGMRSGKGDFHVVQGDVCFARGEWEKAREHFDVAYQIHAASKQRGSAITALHKLCGTTLEESDWKYASVMASKFAQECKELADLALYRSTEADEEASKKNAEGMRLFCEGGDINEARELFRSAHEQVPSNFWYQMNLAFANAKRGYWSDAAKSLEGALRCAPEPLRVPRLYRCWRDFLVNHAESTYRQGNISKAITGIDDALRSVDPFLPADDLVALRARLGDYLWGEGQSEKARQTYAIAANLAGNMRLEREKLQLTVRQAALKAGKSQLFDAVSDLKTQLTRIEDDALDSLKDVFTDVAELIRTPEQFRGVTDLLRALRTTEGMNEHVIGALNDQLLDLSSLHFRRLMYPLSRLKLPTKYPLLPLVTPIALEVDAGLVPTDDVPGLRWMLDKGFPSMRAKVLRETGVGVPGVRIRANETVLPGGYFHSLFDAPLYLYTVYEGKRFCTEVEKCRNKGISGLEAENYGPSGGRGLWLDESQWAKAEEAGLPLWDPYEYMTHHTESVVRANLPNFLGVQELRILLDDWMAGKAPFEVLSKEQRSVRQTLFDKVVKDDHVFQRLLHVLRSLLHENVPILRLEQILTEFFATGTEQVGDEVEIIERVRMVLQYDLPGNRDKRALISIPETLELPLLSGVHREDGKVFIALPPVQVQDFLFEIRNLLPQTGRTDIALVVSMPEARPLASAMLALEFPNIPVLARREVVSSP